MSALNPLTLLQSGNPMIQGGIGLTVFGVATQWAKQLPKSVWRFATRGLWLSIEATDEDECFEWLMRWLALKLEEKRSTTFRLASHWTEDEEGGGSKRHTVLVPGPSQRVLRYQGVKFAVHIGEEKEGIKRTRSVRLLCRKNKRETLAALLKDVGQFEARPDPTVTKIFRPGSGMHHGGWQRHATRPVRSSDSIVLDGAVYETLRTQLTEFEGKHSWYLGLGIPYRIGVLLYGPPGNGKSSLAFALAGAMGRDLYVLPLGDPSMDDEKLVHLMGHVPSRSLVVMEDFDTVFMGRERKADNKLTLSGVLNVMDGPLATEGRILMLTANHPEVLDPAIVRAGRVDIRCFLGNATADQARRLLARFHPTATVADVASFAAWAGDGRYSMASLQAHLVNTMGDLTAALTKQEPTALVVERVMPLVPTEHDDDE